MLLNLVLSSWLCSLFMLGSQLISIGSLFACFWIVVSTKYHLYCGLLLIRNEYANGFWELTISPSANALWESEAPEHFTHGLKSTALPACYPFCCNWHARTIGEQCLSPIFNGTQRTPPEILNAFITVHMVGPQQSDGVFSFEKYIFCVHTDFL